MTKDLLGVKLVDLAHDILDVREKFYTQTLDFDKCIGLEEKLKETVEHMD